LAKNADKNPGSYVTEQSLSWDTYFCGFPG